MVGLGGFGHSARHRLFVHQQLASGAAGRKSSYGERSALECSVPDSTAGRHRSFVRSVWEMELSGMAWSRAEDSELSCSWNRCLDPGTARVRLVLLCHGRVVSAPNAGWRRFATLPRRRVQLFWPGLSADS